MLPRSACSRLPAGAMAAGTASSLQWTPRTVPGRDLRAAEGGPAQPEGRWRWTPAPIYSSAADAQTPAAFMTLCGLGARWKSKLTQGPCPADYGLTATVETRSKFPPRCLPCPLVRVRGCPMILTDFAFRASVPFTTPHTPLPPSQPLAVC